jgi:hypothetical protein
VVCAKVFRAAKAIAEAAETTHAKRNCATGLKFLQSTAATLFSLDLSLFQFREAKQIANARNRARAIEALASRYIESDHFEAADVARQIFEWNQDIAVVRDALLKFPDSSSG